MNTKLEELSYLDAFPIPLLTAKVMYLMVRDGVDKEGWTTASYGDFSRMTSLTPKRTYDLVQRLKAHGLIEQRQEKARSNAPNQYRIIN